MRPGIALIGRRVCLLAAIWLACSWLPAGPATTERIVVNRFSGVAIEGFDPVAYFADEQAVRDYCARHGLAVIATVPFDRAVVEADRAGAALIDQAPDAPAVAEIRRLAHELTGHDGGQSAG